MAPIKILKKRPAAAAGEEGGKKVPKSVVSIRREQCSVVAEALLGATGLSQPVVNMLSNKTLLKESLAVPKEERHPFQEQVIQMISEVMETLETNLKTEIEEAEKKLAASDTDKAAKEGAEIAAKEALEAKKAETEAAKAASSEAVEAAKAAKAALATAESEQQDGDADLDAASAKKELLEKAKDEAFAKVKAGELEAKPLSKAVEGLVGVATDFAFDGTLITTMPSALGKAPGARGAFDDMVFKQVEDALAKNIAALAETLATGDTGKTERATKVAAAKEAVEAAEAAKTAKGEAKTAAVAAQKEAEVALKAAVKEVKNHGPLTKQSQKDSETAKLALEEFLYGPKIALADLVAFTMVVPEEPPEAPADAEAAPAEPAAEPAPAVPTA
jgi:hypothetical protein